MTDQLYWIKSGRCDTANCAEVSIGDASVAIRNSDKPDQYIVFSILDWHTFIEGVKAGEFNV